MNLCSVEWSFRTGEEKPLAAHSSAIRMRSLDLGAVGLLPPHLLGVFRRSTISCRSRRDLDVRLGDGFIGYRFSGVSTRFRLTWLRYIHDCFIPLRWYLKRRVCPHTNRTCFLGCLGWLAFDRQPCRGQCRREVKNTFSANFVSPLPTRHRPVESAP
jgi:hypothetical protein